MNQNPWVEMRDGHAPRLWLSLPEGNLLISWETMKKIRATSDFLNIVFECEYGIYGIITFASSEPLRELYELMQMEMVRKIDGTRLAVKVDEIPE